MKKITSKQPQSTSPTVRDGAKVLRFPSRKFGGQRYDPHGIQSLKRKRGRLVHRYRTLRQQTATLQPFIRLVEVGRSMLRGEIVECKLGIASIDEILKDAQSNGQ